MRGKLAFPGLLIIVALLTACSVSTEFVVLNKSSVPARVSYRIKGCTSESFKTYERPARIGLDEFEKGLRNWRYLADEDLWYESETCTVTVDLAARESLLVLQTMGSFEELNVEERAKRFTLKSLWVEGARGKVSFEGEQLEPHFAEKSGRYVITYE